MNVFIFTLLRYGFLALIWLFVLLIVWAVKNDLAGTPSKKFRRNRKSAPSVSSATPASPDFSATPGALSNFPDPRLVVVAGPLTGTILPLGNHPVIVGRSPDSALVLDDGYASSRHARFFHQNSQQGTVFFVEDLNSTNGTWINQQQIFQPYPLSPGLQITIGKTVLEFMQ